MPAAPAPAPRFEIPAPFVAPEVVVRPEWIDNNNHLNVGYYHVVFDEAASPFFRFLGMTREYRTEHDATVFALESHLTFLREVTEGDRLRLEAQLLDYDYKRIHFFVRMFHAEAGYLAATCESISSHVDRTARRTAPMADTLQARLAAILDVHGKLPRPPQVGHVISTRPRR